MATLTISVTDEDIQYGERLNCEDCPVARAALRELNAHHGSTLVEVGPHMLTYWIAEYNGAVGIEIHLPDEVGDRISAYDNGGTMEPFAFAVDVPD
jgi:hypothetical protein